MTRLAIEASGVGKVFGKGDYAVRALDGVDLIVRLLRTVLGSVSSRLLEEPACPILVVPRGTELSGGRAPSQPFAA